MIRVTPRPAGLDRLRGQIAALPAGVRQAATAGLFALGLQTAADIRRCLRREPGSPSAPGAPPDDVEAHLAEALVVTGSDSGVRVAVDLPYAQDLEFGTTKMAARPFLRPAAMRAGQGAATVLAPLVHAALKDRR